MQLRHASVIVTGGASGLGEATARMIAERHPWTHVVVVDVQDDRGEQVADDVKGTYVHADITDPELVTAAIETAAGHGQLRAVVSCAGGGSSRRTIGRDGQYSSAHPLDEFERVVRLNVVGTFNVIRLAATAMSRNDPDERGGRGAIVATASVAGVEGQIGQAAYAAGKAGVIGMTLPIARDLAATG